jgi:putative ABC transport system permease protein
MRSMLHGARSAIRLARREPAFVALVVLTLAVGVGATTATMNVAAAVLLEPLPISDDSRVVLIARRLSASATLVPFTHSEVVDWGEASRTLQSVAGVQYDGAVAAFVPLQRAGRADPVVLLRSD